MSLKWIQIVRHSCHMSDIPDVLLIALNFIQITTFWWLPEEMGLHTYGDPIWNRFCFWKSFLLLIWIFVGLEKFRNWWLPGIYWWNSINQKSFMWIEWTSKCCHFLWLDLRSRPMRYRFVGSKRKYIRLSDGRISGAIGRTRPGADRRLRSRIRSTYRDLIARHDIQIMGLQGYHTFRQCFSGTHRVCLTFYSNID